MVVNNSESRRVTIYGEGGGGLKPEQINNYLNNDLKLFLKLTGFEYIYLSFGSGTFSRTNQSIKRTRYFYPDFHFN